MWDDFELMWLTSKTHKKNGFPLSLSLANISPTTHTRSSMQRRYYLFLLYVVRDTLCNYSYLFDKWESEGSNIDERKDCFASGYPPIVGARRIPSANGRYLALIVPYTSPILRSSASGLLPRYWWLTILAGVFSSPVLF